MVFWAFFRTLNQLKLTKPWVFFENSLSLSWKSLRFLKICLSLVKKSSFGAIFLENFTETEQMKKKIGFQLANYWVFNKLAWVFWEQLLEFFGIHLEFFRHVQKSLHICFILAKERPPFSQPREQISFNPWISTFSPPSYF